MAFLTAAALICVVAGALGLVRADDGLVRAQRTAGGTPVEVVTPEGVTERLPGVVVLHGYAGSARLMRGFADTLARRGYVVALPDLTGHGANGRRLPEAGDAWDRAIQADLAGAVRLLRSLPAVDPERIALVGHSMGAGAVAAFAGRDPSIGRTVAISLGAGDFGTPAELLVLYGGLEFEGFRAAAEEAARDGVARRVVDVPGVEHISVLYSSRTHAETARWLTGAEGETHPRDRLIPGALLLLGAILGMLPLARFGGGRHDRDVGDDPDGPAPAPAARWWWVLVAVPVAVLGARLAGPLPLAVGDYAAGYFLIIGLVLTAAGRRRPRFGAAPVTAAVLVGYAAAAVAVPIHLGLTHAWPVGDRWWLLPVVTLCCAVFLHGAETASGGRVGRHALILALAAGGLLAAAMVGVAPGFVVLVVPLLVVLLAWQAVWAAVLRRRRAPAWLVAMVGAVVLAWPLATALPLAA